jgi:putative Mg2+ transporter-C (MgtC) family protein
MSELHIILRLFLAALLGGLIGMERDMHGRAAGLRTHILVCLGSALFMVISQYVAITTGDPGRIAAQVVSGIGFVGAGAIIKSGLTIRGLTTAACLWISASIGLACVAGLFIIAIFTTVLSLMALILLNHFEKWYKRDSYRILTIESDIGSNISKIVKSVKNGKNLDIIFFDQDKNYTEGILTSRLHVRLSERGKTDKLAHEIIESLEKEELDIKRIIWHHV